MVQSAKLENKVKSKGDSNRGVRAKIDYERLGRMIRKIVREELREARYPLISSQEQEELENLYSKETLREAYKEEENQIY